MTKSKHTKKAFLASVLSMMLCVAMLIGATFAWFTDSVTSGRNKIVAGNLDVELYHTNGKVSEEKVGADTKLFVNKDGSDILWEPGVMVYENFTVKNAGTLALKYNLKMNVGDFNTVKDTEKSLKDVLKVAVLDGAFTGTREAAQGLTFDQTIADFEKEGNIAAEAADDTYAVVIYWEPSEVDNEYNLNNGKESSDKTPLHIDLGVNLVATQDTVEKDSFGPDYDRTAGLIQEGYVVAGTSDTLISALEEGRNVVLEKNISEEASIASPYGHPAGYVMNGGVLDGNGKTLSITKAGGGEFYGVMTSGGTIKNLTIDEGYRAVMIMYPKEDIILDNANIGGRGVGYAINTGESAGVDGIDLIASNCSFKGWLSFALIESASFTKCNFEQGTYYGATSLYGRLVKPYVNTTFKDCTFIRNYYIDLSALGVGCTITLDNCSVDGTVLTADNWEGLLEAIELPSGRTIQDCVIFK